MIVGIFKKNLFINSLLLLPFAIVLRLYSLVYPTTISPIANGGFFYTTLMDILPKSPVLYSIISIFIVFLEAVLINRLVIKNRFSRDITLLPGMFFIILVSLSPSMHTLSPFVFGLLFIIISFINLFKTYKKFQSERYLFNTGLYFGIAIMFCNNFIILLIPIILGMISIRAFKIKELFQFLFGIILIVYLYTFWMFWIGEPVIFPTLNIYYMKEIFDDGIFKNIIISSYLFIILNTIVTYRKFIIKKSIQSQKKINIIFWFLLFTIIVVIFIHPNSFYNYLHIIAFPLSIFTSMIFLRMRNNLIAEIVSVVIIFAILIYHFQFYA